MEKFIFDTNAFNKALDDVPSTKKSIKIYASHIQLREINNTACDIRRKKLLTIFHKLTDEQLPTESAVFPIKLGSIKFGDGTYEKLRNELDHETSKLPSGKRKRKLKNNPNDAQIAEIALKNRITLVTDDADVLNVMRNNGGHAIRYDAFKAKIT